MGGQAVLGAIDQALLAAAHFTLGILIARMGGLAAMGSFAFAYAVIVLVNMLHAAAIADVYSVLASADMIADRYGATPILICTAIGYGVCALAIVLVGTHFDELRVATTNLAFHAALLSSCCYWSSKPYFYRHGRPAMVLLGTGIYAATVLGVTIAGYRGIGKDVQPLWSIAWAATAASLPLLLWTKRPDLHCMLGVGRYLRDCLQHARWAVPASLLIWITANGYVFMMPILGQTEQAGGLRAVINLLMPVNTLLVGACTALLPLFARIYQDASPTAYARLVHGCAAGALVASLAFAAIVALWSETWIALIYGDAFAAYADALRIAALLPALWAMASVYRAAIRAGARTLDMFKVYAFALFPVGLLLLLWLSPQGAIAALKGMVVTQALVVGAFLYRFVKLPKRNLP